MIRKKNPYQNLSEASFWKVAISDKNMFDIGNLWSPKFIIEPHHRVSTFGSCFAQYFGASLKAHGFNWFITEPAPLGLSDTNKKKFGYDLFTCRTGNIYTTSLLKQWVNWALEKSDFPSEYWEYEGRFYDPFRPNIEPLGFCSIEEMFSSREQAIKSFGKAIKKSDIIVFTLGLTESWFNKELGYEYPMCPGTIAGVYDEQSHIFMNQQFEFVRRNLSEAIDSIQHVNKKARFILTVSPVPLSATKSESHVLVATMESKSILRAVAGQLSKNRPSVDYFPSYEIINGTPFKGIFFESNQRSVSKVGVSYVMDTFFASLDKNLNVSQNTTFHEKTDAATNLTELDDSMCDEELLAAFTGTKK